MGVEDIEQQSFLTKVEITAWLWKIRANIKDKKAGKFKFGEPAVLINIAGSLQTV